MKSGAVFTLQLQKRGEHNESKNAGAERVWPTVRQRQKFRALDDTHTHFGDPGGRRQTLRGPHVAGVPRSPRLPAGAVPGVHPHPQQQRHAAAPLPSPLVQGGAGPPIGVRAGLPGRHSKAQRPGSQGEGQAHGLKCLTLGQGAAPDLYGWCTMREQRQCATTHQHNDGPAPGWGWIPHGSFGTHRTPCTLPRLDPTPLWHRFDLLCCRLVNDVRWGCGNNRRLLRM